MAKNRRHQLGVTGAAHFADSEALNGPSLLGKLLRRAGPVMPPDALANAPRRVQLAVQVLHDYANEGQLQPPGEAAP